MAHGKIDNEYSDDYIQSKLPSIKIRVRANSLQDHGDIIYLLHSFVIV